MRLPKTSSRVSLALLLAIAMLLPLTGCGRKRVALAALSGRVTFQGEPVKKGARIVFINPQTATYINSQLDDDGRYRVDVGEGYGLYPGEYKVAIRLNEPPYSGIPGDPMPPPSKRADVPARYHSVKTSGLSLKLEPSGAVYNVDLTP